LISWLGEMERKPTTARAGNPCPATAKLKLILEDCVVQEKLEKSQQKRKNGPPTPAKKSYKHLTIQAAKKALGTNIGSTNVGGGQHFLLRPDPQKGPAGDGITSNRRHFPPGPPGPGPLPQTAILQFHFPTGLGIKVPRQVQPRFPPMAARPGTIEYDPSPTHAKKKNNRATKFFRTPNTVRGFLTRASFFWEHQVLYPAWNPLSGDSLPVTRTMPLKLLRVSLSPPAHFVLTGRLTPGVFPAH